GQLLQVREGAFGPGRGKKMSQAGTSFRDRPEQVPGPRGAAHFPNPSSARRSGHPSRAACGHPRCPGGFESRAWRSAPARAGSGGANAVRSIETAHPPLDNPKWERFAQDPDCKGSTMTDDERAIRELVNVWLAASKAGDLQTILSLMTDDVIFMVPGRRPFGKEAFAAASQGMQNVTMEGASDIQEIQVLGDWAYLRNYIEMVVTPPNGAPVRRSGYTLTILRKES